MGVGEKPSWFKNDKYKTVSAQAEAYVALESRFGSFTGAPKDGKYAFKAPEGIDFSADHPLVNDFTKWAAENQLSQAGYDQLLTRLIEHEVAQQPNWDQIRTNIGADVDERMAQTTGWVKANLGAEGFSLLRQATSGTNADSVFKLVESLVNKSGQVRLPSATRGDAPATAATAGEGLSAIQAQFGAKTADGRLRTEVEPGYRAGLEAKLKEYFDGMPAGTQYHGSRTN
jgi:hypothetical protein